MLSWIALIITTSGTVSLQPQSSFCGLPLHWSWQCTDHACKEGEDILLNESSVTILQPNIAPNLRGFIPERMRLHPVWWKRRCEDTTVLRFWKADSCWSLWQESLSHTHIDSDPLISLRKIYSVHVLLITQQRKPYSACSRIQQFIWLYCLHSSSSRSKTELPFSSYWWWRLPQVCIYDAKTPGCHHKAKHLLPLIKGSHSS